MLIMDPQTNDTTLSSLDERIGRLEQKIDLTYQSAEKTRKYIMWTGIITAVVIVVPLLFLPFAIGSLLSTYSSAMNLTNM